MNMDKLYFFSPERMAFFDTPIPGSFQIDTRLATGIINRIKLGHQLKVRSDGQPYTVVPKYFRSDIRLLYRYKVTALNEEYEVCCDVLRGEYPPTETVSFSLQLLEAVQYKQWLDSDRTTAEPVLHYINKLSKARDYRGVGEGLEDLVNRILNNATLYNTGMSMLTAYRHSIEKELKSYADDRNFEMLESKSWDFKSILDRLGL